MEENGQLHAPATLPFRGKTPWYPLNRRLGEPQSRSGHFGEEKNVLTQRRIVTQIIQPIA
jgi:hypothetical protein